jgi:hypothetical protein
MLTAHFGYRWFDFDQFPELLAFLAFLAFCTPFAIQHRRHGDFPPVFRLVGTIVFFLCIVLLAELGMPSYLSLSHGNVERLYSG